MAAQKEEFVRKIIHEVSENNRINTNEIKQFNMQLQTEIIIKMEDMSQRIALLEAAMGNKAKPRAERKTATAKATTAPAKGAAAPAKRVPVTWTQYVAWKMEDNDEYYKEMMDNKQYKAAADAVKGIDKVKDEATKRKKQGTAIANWIKQNDEELVEAIKTEHKEFKANAAKTPPPVQQKADVDSDDDAGAVDE